MPTELLIAVITAAQAIGVAIIAGLFNYTTKKREKHDNAKEELDKALYRLVLADSNGTELLLMNADGQHLNGNVKNAIANIDSARTNFENLCVAEAAKL